MSLYVPRGDLEIKAVSDDGRHGVTRVAVAGAARASTEIVIQPPRSRQD